MAGEISQISAILGMSPLVLIILLIWSLAWKAVALWKSARNKHLVWFIVLLVVNTMGILEIIYIFLFSKLHLEAEKTEKNLIKPARAKTRAKAKKRRKIR